MSSETIWTYETCTSCGEVRECSSDLGGWPVCSPCGESQPSIVGERNCSHCSRVVPCFADRARFGFVCQPCLDTIPTWTIVAGMVATWASSRTTKDGRQGFEVQLCGGRSPDQPYVGIETWARGKGWGIPESRRDSEGMTWMTWAPPGP